MSGRTQDRQLTIDQLVQAYVPADSLPGRPDPAAPAGTAEGPAEQDRENRQSAMPENTILAVSEALFGDGSAEDEQAENAGREPPDAADSGKSR